MTPRLSSLALCALAVAVVLVGCGGGDDSSGEAPHRRASGNTQTPAFIGVGAGPLVAYSPPIVKRELALMARDGVQSLRIPFYWNQQQPYETRADVPASNRDSFDVLGGVPTDLHVTDTIVGDAARHHIGVLPIPMIPPRWAAADPDKAGSPPAGTAAYSRYLRTLVQRYGPKGSFWSQHPKIPREPIRAWQIWNEPSHDYYWSQQPFARGYVRLLRAADRTLHAADPGAKVVLAGFPDRSWESLRAIYRAGGRRYFDIAAIHPYTLRPANVLRILRLDRKEMRRHGDASKPIWVTEVTWSSGKGRVTNPLGFEVSEQGQARNLERTIPAIARQRRTLGIERIYWESWMTGDTNKANTFDYSGLRELHLNGSARNKPALYAYERVARRLDPCATKHIARVCP